MNNKQLFMYLYMIELETYLVQHKDEIKSISFQSDEANTDRPLKEYLKKAIGKDCSSLVRFRDASSLTVNDALYDIPESVKSAKIINVTLPDELSEQIKTATRKDSAVYTNPDICLIIDIDNEIQYEPIELKSTKTDSIPGSSVRQINPNEWVVFIKHTKTDVEIVTGQYYNAINARLQFPDRSPRPQISFGELKKWANQCRKTENTSIEYKSEEKEEKSYLINNWQDVLSKRWVKTVFEKHPKAKAPWFDNNLRKFIIDFLDVYSKMSDAEKEEYLNMLKSITE